MELPLMRNTNFKRNIQWFSHNQNVTHTKRAPFHAPVAINCILEFKNFAKTQFNANRSLTILSLQLRIKILLC